jgi:hypothetical protein
MTIVKGETNPAPEGYGALLVEIKERVGMREYAVCRFLSRILSESHPKAVQ